MKVYRWSLILFCVAIFAAFGVSTLFALVQGTPSASARPTNPLVAPQPTYAVGLTEGTTTAGPPYPDAVTGQRVYDYAHIFSDAEIATAQSEIWTIENRVGVQIAVYTQVKPESDTLDKANADALALMNQWGVGRKGFDDGLVILFDMQDNLRHGQVSLYAGSGYRAAYLSDSERQAIFDNDMKPLLLDGRFDDALSAALSDIDQNATPEHKANLERARIINAGVGIGVLILSFFLVLFAVLNWWRVGRDPVYTDDSSVLMPAPPDDLTPAMATLLMTDQATTRTVAAGLVDLAARGRIQFERDEGLFGGTTKIGATGPTDEGTSPESKLACAVDSAAGPDRWVDPKDHGSASYLHAAVGDFRSAIEELAVARGWFTAKPSSVVVKWSVLGLVEFIAAGALIWWTFYVEASGGFLGAAGLIVAGIATLIAGWFMPSRTLNGSMLRAMLAAYSRTLKMTLDQSKSMTEVVDRRPLPWVKTPDEEMAWGVAFGLDKEIDGVMRRTVEDMQTSGVTAQTWYPHWYSTPGHSSFAGGGGGATSGLYSASMIPDLGSMSAALGSIGSTGSSSGGGGGGFGGGGGGGGGGAGGGF